MTKRTQLGLGAIFGVWITAGVALPLVNILKEFSPEQLLAARGFLTAVLALLLAKGKVITTDKYTYYIFLCLPFASLGLFEGIRSWGVSPTIIIIAATPLVNFLISFLSGKQVPRPAIIGLILTLAGVIAARWGGTFNLIGFGWSVFGTICNGIVYELFARARSTPLQRCFWACLGIGLMGLAGEGSYQRWSIVGHSLHLQLTLFAFAFVGGFLYWLSNLIAFENLDKDVASVLAQGETPAVILFAGVLLGERLTTLQWVGVFLSLYGAWHLSRSFTKKS